MTKIYDQHAAAFANVAAYIVMKDGENVAKIAFKFPRDGAGRLYAYVHWFGLEMVRGFAGGYGYDKRTAAVVDAVRKIDWAAQGDAAVDFARALASDGGSYWDNKLRDAGFIVFQAV